MEYTGSSDDAQMRLPHHHTLHAVEQMVASLSTPAEHFGHSVEELLDLHRTRHHGGDYVVSHATMAEALKPTRNAVRVVVRNARGELKQLVFGGNIRSNNGGIQETLALGGDVNANIGYKSTGNQTWTATTVTPAVSPVWTSNQWAGHILVPLTGEGYANIISNTATALTFDQITNITSTTGAAGSTPAANSAFVILNAMAQSFWIAISTDSATVDVGNTTLPSEQTTGFSANPRWKGVYSLTTTPTGTGTTQQSAVYKLDAGVQTYTGGGVTIAKLGLFHHQTGGNLDYVKLLASTAVLATSDTIDPSWSLTRS